MTKTQNSLFILLCVFIFIVLPITVSMLLRKSRKFLCDTSSKSCIQDSTGNYNTLDDCKKNCGNTPTSKYTCNTNSECIQDSTGNYNTLDDCKKNCGNTPPPTPTITFTFEDDQTETFPYDIKNKYYTSRGISAGCPSSFPPSTGGKPFLMKNQGVPFKYTLSNAQSTNIVMSGYNGAGDFCQSGIWKTSPNQDLHSDLGNWVWDNGFSLFFTQQ